MMKNYHSPFKYVKIFDHLQSIPGGSEPTGLLRIPLHLFFLKPTHPKPKTFYLPVTVHRLRFLVCLQDEWLTRPSFDVKNFFNLAGRSAAW
jgi:hypothetical protein